MLKIIYRPHFKFRANQRKIDSKLARQVYLGADSKYFDTLRKHFVALKKMKMEGKTVTLILAYDKIGKAVEFIIIHKIREKEVKNKIQSGRWKDEKN